MEGGDNVEKAGRRSGPVGEGESIPPVPTPDVTAAVLPQSDTASAATAPIEAADPAETDDASEDVPDHRRWRPSKITLTLGGIATLAALMIAALSLVRDVTDFTVEETPSSTAPAAASPPTSGPQAATETQIVYERPWDNSGQLQTSLTPTEHHPATCIASPVSGDPEALRCFTADASGLVLDPCWPSPGADSAACPTSPWSNDVVLLDDIKSESPVAQSGAAGGQGEPAKFWAIELASGQRCQSEAGATNIVAGMRVNYLCSGETSGAIGELDRTKPLWRILFSSDGDPQFTYVDVVRVWV